MAELLTDVSAVFTSLLSMAADVVTFITDNPLVLLPILIGLGFTAVRLFKAIR